MIKILRSVLIGIFIVAVGVILLGIGSINGGEKRIIWQDGKFIIPQNQTINKHVKAFKNIDISGDALQVTLVRDNQDTSGYLVIGQVSNADGLNITQENGTLKIEYKEAHSHVPNFAKTNQDMDRISVKVPAGIKLDSIKTRVKSGDVAVKRLESKKVNLRTDYGRISTTNVTASTLKVKNYAGIIIDDNTRADKLDLVNTYGSILVHESKATTSRLHVSSAEITATDSDLGKALISVDSGNTTLRNVQANNILAQSTSGDYNIENVKFTGSNVIFTKMGNIDTTGFNEDGYRLQIQNSGMINFKGKEIKNSYDANVNATNRVMLSTYDGDIVVK